MQRGEYLVEFGDDPDESNLCHGCAYAELARVRAELEATKQAGDAAARRMAIANEAVDELRRRDPDAGAWLEGYFRKAAEAEGL